MAHSRWFLSLRCNMGQPSGNKVRVASLGPSAVGQRADQALGSGHAGGVSWVA